MKKNRFNFRSFPSIVFFMFGSRTGEKTGDRRKRCCVASGVLQRMWQRWHSAFHPAVLGSILPKIDSVNGGAWEWDHCHYLHFWFPPFRSWRTCFFYFDVICYVWTDCLTLRCAVRISTMIGYAIWTWWPSRDVPFLFAVRLPFRWWWLLIGWDCGADRHNRAAGVNIFH